jgi:hypothetical protein
MGWERFPFLLRVTPAQKASFRISKVDDDRAAFREAWKYRTAVRRFQSAFAAAEELAEPERQLLLEQVAGYSSI